MSPSLAKGTVYLTFSGLLFMGSGYLVQVLIGRFFDPATYGTFGVVIYLLNIINTILASGFFQGISRSIAEKESAARTILKKGLKIEIIITGIFAIIYFVLSSQIANFFNDPQMASYLRLTALIIPIYGIRTVFNGLLNGLKRFDKQAIVQIVAAFVKLGLVVVFLILNLPLGAILVAYFLAALAGLVTSCLFSKVNNGVDNFSTKRLVQITLAISVYSFIFPLLMSIDLFLVKYFITDASSAGYYNSATTLSRFLYILLSGFMMSLLPIVSGHFYRNNLTKVQQYSRQAIRFSLMVLLPLAIISSLTARALIPFIFSNKYLQAVEPFRILIFGVAILTLAHILLTLIVAIGKQNISLYFTVGLLIIGLILNSVLIPIYKLNGAAWATTLVGIFGIIISFFYLKAKIRNFIRWISVFKISLASLVVGLLSYWLINNFSFRGLNIILWYGSLLVVYFLLLLLFKEIGKNDILLFKRIVIRRDNESEKEHNLKLDE